MNDLAVVNNNAGLELTVLDARSSTTLADCGPNTWPMQDVTISNPRVPFYLPSMDVGWALLGGQEEVCKVQLTQLADGCILGITLSHTLTDGMHWSALMRHIAARYREVTTGRAAKQEELVSTVDRRQGLSLEQMRSKLLTTGANEWSPTPFVVAPSWYDYIKAAGLLFSNASARIQHTIIFISKERIAALKAAVVAHSPAEQANKLVSTGDVVQALGALAVHAAEGRQSLVPVRPHCMVALIQVPGAEPSYFGNAVHPMTVGVEEHEGEKRQLPGTTDLIGNLCCLASLIRAAVLEIRSDPTKALQALYESQQVCNTPVAQALAFLAGQRLPFVTCTTNFIGNLPIDQNLDFGLAGGAKPIGYRSLTYPLARGMAVIRPSMVPYGEGLFLSLSLTAAQVKALKEHSLLKTLVPDAQFLGENR